MIGRSWTRLSVLVLILVLALTALGSWTVRGVVHNQENRLLRERGNEVGLVLKEAADSLTSELRTVGGVLEATDSSPAAFRRASAALVASSQGRDSIALLRQSSSGFRVQLADGDAFARGQQLTGTVASTLTRAASAGDVLPTQIMGAGADRRIGFALGPPAAPAGTVLYLQLVLGTLGPPQSAGTSPFDELHVVLYGTPTPLPSQALVTTTTEVPLRGDVRTVPVPVGAASWSLQVSAAHPLVGATAANAQWLTLAGGVALAILLALVVEIESRRRRSALALYHNEHRLAEGLQRSLLPALPSVDGLELAARYLPGSSGQQVGGDWYDVFELDGGYVGLVIGDVLGHDIDAAVLMSRVQTALRAHALVGEQPAAVLDRLDQVVKSLQTDRLVTVFYGLLEPQDADGNRRLVFANAGHPPPLLHDPRNGTREIDEADSLLLGVPMLHTEARTQKAIVLPPDATLVFYTDGLIEVPGLSLTDLIANLREATTAAVRDASAAQVCERLVAKIHPTARRDDVAILVVQLPSATLSGCARSRRVFAVAAGCACVVFTGAALAGPAASAAPTATPQSGFWWIAEPIAGLIPVPSVPMGGLYVASAPTGAQAESAIRIPLTVSAESVRLTLQVSALTRVNAPSVVGYPATGDWPPGGPQPWSARPAYRTAATPAVGVFDAGNKTMTITFPASEATAGIVLVPGTNQMLAPTFTVSFDPVTAADITVLDTVRPTGPSPVAAPPTHRPTHSPVASRPPSRTASPRASASTSPSRRPSHRPKPTKSHAGGTSNPRPTSPQATAASASGHSGRDIAIAFGVVLIAAGVSLLAWRRRPHG